jgi:hypothetical protein
LLVHLEELVVGDVRHLRVVEHSTVVVEYLYAVSGTAF